MASRATFTHNFKHLLNEKPFVAQKPARRFPQGPAQKVKGLAHPRDRVKYWNVQPGDKIGIFRGNYKPSAPAGEEGGRDTVFEVHDVDKRKNLVEIKDLSSKSRSLTTPSLARVHYSNIGLYMGKFPVKTKVNGQVVEETKDVFATRLITTEPKWNPYLGHFVWRRFAASTWPVIEGYEKLPYSKRRRAPHPALGRSTLVEIPWPVQKRWQAPEPTPGLDTLASAVERVTFTATTEGMSTLGQHLTPGAFPPRPSNPSHPLAAGAEIERTYLRATLSPESYAALPSSLPMELFLIRELANPHSRAKKQARWQARMSYEEELKTKMIRAEMQDLQGRKRASARREAVFRWQARVEGERKERAREAWVQRGGLEDLARVKRQAEKREKRKERKMREIQLGLGEKNQVVPKAVQVEATA